MRLLLPFLIASSLATSVFAQEAQPQNTPPSPSISERIGDWRYLCFGPETDRECGAVQVQVNEREQRVLEARLVNVNGNDVALLLILPLGINLREGAGISVDGEELGTAGFDVCTPEGCQVLVVPSPDEMTKFKKGIEATISVVAGGNNRVAIPLSLKGFTASEKKLREN